MSKFKVGDRVRVLYGAKVGSYAAIGNTYTVVGLSDDGYLIDGNMQHPAAKGWFMIEGELELAELQDDEPTEALEELMRDKEGAWRDNIKDCKPPMRYVNPNLVEGMAFGMLAGELKYESFNFLKGFKYSVILESLERHLNAIKKGEEFDEQTTQILREGYTCPRTGVFKPGFGDKAPKIRHEWLIACNLNMIQWCREQGTLTEDRLNVKE